MGERRPRFKTAVGLQYDSGAEEVPAVTLKGRELEADRIVALARRFGVAVVENPEIAKALSALEIDQEIPEALYQAIAIVLNGLERARHKKGSS